MTGSKPEVLNIAGSLVGLALIFLLGFSLWSLFHLDVPAPNKDVLLIVIGALTTKVGTIVDFFFGGSQGTKKQAETIDALAKAAATTAPAAADVVLKPGDTATVSATPDP